MTIDIALPTLAYTVDTDRDELRALLAEAQEQGPLALGPYGPEVLSYDLVRTVLRDSRFLIPQGMTLAVQGIVAGPIWERVTKLLVSIDGTQHQRPRRLVARSFTPRAAERMRGACVEVITELVDRHAGTGRCDFVNDIADPYPIPIICALLGAPRQDWHLFSAWAADISKAFGCSVAENESSILRAWAGLEGYVEELIATRRRSLSDDLISELIRVEDNVDRLSHEELVNLAVILLNAGTDTTRNQLAAAVQTLAAHPEQWELLAEHPELAPQAVEELMRHSPIVLGALRKAAVDVELAGVRFAAGSLVIANTAAANWDPAVYDRPDGLDITRRGAPAMLSFGGGVHYCLGAHLARLEMAEALRVITARMANVRCTGLVPWKPMTGISGPTTLPSAFDTR
jgi:cytochrome P450